MSIRNWNPWMVVAGLGLVLVSVPGSARAQYVQLWSLNSTGGPDAMTFDLGDESMDLLFPMTQSGSQGAWQGGTAHSARSLARPGVNSVHGNVILPWQAHTVYGDTDGDGQMEFVSDNVMNRQIVVWNGATGIVEGRIPYPPAATQILYVVLIDVNAQNARGSCEIIAHWWAPGNQWGTTCWGSVNGAL